MRGSLVNGRALFWTVLIIAGLLFWPIKVLRWQRDTYACFGGRTWHVGQWEEVFPMSSLKVGFYPILHDCPDSDRYDPKKYKAATP